MTDPADPTPPSNPSDNPSDNLELAVPEHVLEHLVAKIMSVVAGDRPEAVADALGVAFARHCKAYFDAPGLTPGRAYGYVDTTVPDEKLGPMQVRVVTFWKNQGVDRTRKYG